MSESDKVAMSEFYFTIDSVYEKIRRYKFPELSEATAFFWTPIHMYQIIFVLSKLPIKTFDMYFFILAFYVHILNNCFIRN